MLRVAHLDQTRSRAELPDLLARAAEAGYDGVELVIGPGDTGEWLESEESCRAIAGQAERCGTRVRSALLADHPAVRLAPADPRQRRSNLERVRAFAQRCRWLGAQTMRLVPAELGPGPEGPLLTYQDALNQTCLSLEELLGDFERCGVVAGVMPCHHGFLLSPPEFRELIDRVNSPWIAAALDVSTCARIAVPADWVATLQGRLTALSMGGPADIDPTDESALLEALRAIRFEGLWIAVVGLK